MNVFVAGATGVVGRRMLPRLIRAGHRVTALTRDPKRAAALAAAGVTAVVGDIFDEERVRAAMVAAAPAAVIHQLTALSGGIDPRRPGASLAATSRLRTEGTRILMAAAQAAGARRFVAQSIATFYTPAGHGLAGEEEPLYLNAPTAFAPPIHALATLDRLVLGTPGIEGIVLRYGFFYGPGTSYAADGEMAVLVRKRQLPLVGRGTGVFSFTHVDDAAAAAVHALDHGEPGIYNIVDDDPAPVAEWLPLYAQLLGAPRPLHLPRWVGRLLVGPFGIYWMTAQRGASNAKAREQMGWRPTIASWRDGWRAELAPAAPRGERPPARAEHTQRTA